MCGFCNVLFRVCFILICVCMCVFCNDRDCVYLGS